MTIRNGWLTEQSRDEAFKRVIEDVKYLNESKRKVIEKLFDGPKTLQEISELTGIKEHLVCARLNDLRKDEFVFANGEKALNKITGKRNSLWEINWKKFQPKELKLF